MENYYYDYYNMYYDSDNYTGNWTYDPTERNPYRVSTSIFVSGFPFSVIILVLHIFDNIERKY